MMILLFVIRLCFIVETILNKENPKKDIKEYQESYLT